MIDNHKKDKERSTLELLDFYAAWCEPCKMLDEILENVTNEIGKRLKISKIDIDQQPQLSARYAISSVPVLVLLRNGKAVWRMNGFLTAPELVRIFRGLVQKEAS